MLVRGDYVDEIMAKVLEKIKQRQTESIKITYSDTKSAPDITVFVNNATVDIMNVPLQLIVDMYGMNTENEWIKWISKGFEYDVQFRFEVSTQVSKFIPLRMVRDWPVLFVVDAFRPVYSVTNRTIARKEVAGLPDNAVIVALADQKMTADAEEIVRSKDIQLQVRNDVDCIWQK